jgi:hypothetical protein
VVALVLGVVLVWSVASNHTTADAGGPTTTAAPAPSAPPPSVPAPPPSPELSDAALAAVCHGDGDPRFHAYDRTKRPPPVPAGTDAKPSRPIAVLFGGPNVPIDAKSVPRDVVSLTFFTGQVGVEFAHSDYQLMACVTGLSWSNPTTCEYRSNGVVTYRETLYEGRYHLSLRVTSTGRQLKSTDFVVKAVCEPVRVSVGGGAAEGKDVAWQPETLIKLVDAFVTGTR